jgi:hypothetical protein
MSLNVRLSGAMATFATRVGGFFFADSNALEMGIFVELKPYVGVTGFTGIAAHISVFTWGSLLWYGLRRLSGLSGNHEKN